MPVIQREWLDDFPIEVKHMALSPEDVIKNVLAAVVTAGALRALPDLRRR